MANSESNHKDVIFMPFSEEQREKVASGDITMTVRNDKNADKLGLEKSEYGFMMVNDTPCLIKCAGKGHIDDVGLDEFKAEALGGDEPSYKDTMRFMLGYTAMNVFMIKTLDETPDVLAEHLAEQEDEGSDEEEVVEDETSEDTSEESTLDLEDEIPF